MLHTNPRRSGSHRKTQVCDLVDVDFAAFLEKAQNIKKLSRDEQKRVIADLVEEIVIRDRGDKYLTFRVFSAPMAKNTSLIQSAPGRLVPVCCVNTLAPFRLFHVRVYTNKNVS